VRYILPFLFSLYDEYVCSPMLIFPMIVYFKRTLSYYCEQSIAKFAIKTGVVIYKLMKQLRLIIVVDLGY
jgi:hypothetical protein